MQKIKAIVIFDAVFYNSVLHKKILFFFSTRRFLVKKKKRRIQNLGENEISYSRMNLVYEIKQVGEYKVEDECINEINFLIRSCK